jgi:DNA-binding beta-propeller fold protein YncE
MHRTTLCRTYSKTNDRVWLVNVWRITVLVSLLFSSFNETCHYQHIEEGPILTNTIVTLSPKTGDVLSSWGAGFFYMPHGITIDHQGNVWVTDVAMHQVFKVKNQPRNNITFFLHSYQIHIIINITMCYNRWWR